MDKSGGSHGTKVGFVCHIFCENPLILQKGHWQGILGYMTPHFMTYFGCMFLANVGGGGGQNCF